MKQQISRVSEIQNKKQHQEDYKKNQQKKYEDLKQQMNEIFSSNAGKNVLKYIINICGYNLSSIYRNNNATIDPLGMAFNEGQRDIYLMMRQFIDTQILKEIENE